MIIVAKINGLISYLTLLKHFTFLKIWLGRKGNIVMKYLKKLKYLKKHTRSSSEDPILTPKCNEITPLNHLKRLLRLYGNNTIYFI